MKCIYLLGWMSCSVTQVKQHFRGTFCLHSQGQRVSRVSKQAHNKQQSCLAFSSILMMEAVCSSKTLVTFSPAPWHSIPEHTIFLMSYSDDDDDDSNMHCSPFLFVCWSGSGASWPAGRMLSDGPFTLELHKFSRERDRLLMAASFMLPLLLLLLLLWILPATAPFPAGS